MTHILNLHHSDWEAGQAGADFYKGSTIESYSDARSVKWALSDRSMQHLLNDPPREKWPGSANLAFGFLLEDHRKRHQDFPDDKWSVIDASGLAAKSRAARASVEQAARAAPRDRSKILPVEGSPVQLELKVPRTTFEVGEPLTLTVGLHNTSKDAAYHIRPLLDPSYGLLTIEIQLPGSDVFLPFRPVVTREARAVRTAPLPPGGERHDEAKVFFGAGGWTFGAPGTYLVRADFPAPAADAAAALSTRQRIQSKLLTLQVVGARTAAGRVASRTMLNSFKSGLDLLIGSASAQLEQIAAMEGTSPQVAAAKIAVINAVNQTPGLAQQTDIKVDKALTYLQQTTSAATGPFSVAQAYDQLAEALEKQGRTSDAAAVRRSLKARLGKVEAAAEALRRVDAPKQ